MDDLKPAKNKAPAEQQITAEQIISESLTHRDPKLKHSSAYETAGIKDLEELNDFRARKRLEYEKALRLNRMDLPQWVRYGLWELQQRDFDRFRSVFERALDVDSTYVPLWIKYIQSELKERNINHARNLLDRAVTVLPRVDKLWFLYVGMEETANDVVKTREVFERWLEWRPPISAWNAYIGFELRLGRENLQRVRDLHKRLVQRHPEPEYWIKWAKFEDDHASASNVREVFELAVDADTASAQGSKLTTDKVLVAWARWETKQKEFARARALYKFGLEHLNKSQSQELYAAYAAFEKQHGSTDGANRVIVEKRRAFYENSLEKDPYDYDGWFSYLSMVQEAGEDPATIRDIFERAISKIPQEAQSKTTQWRRYIYLWVKYAFYEEIEMKDVNRARQIFQLCLSAIPHHVFSFAKIWTLAAKLEIRQLNLPGARKIFGQSLGKSGKPSLFKRYIAVETQLKEFDRVRKIYEKFVEKHSKLASAWIGFAELEEGLFDLERARAIYELAVRQADTVGMDKPDEIWKRYIEFERDNDNIEQTRSLYERLLKTTSHVKVWIAYAMNEVIVDLGDSEDEPSAGADVTIHPSGEMISKARAIFERAWSELKSKGTAEDRVVLHDAWSQFEGLYGTAADAERVQKHQPTVVKKRRKLEDGTWEEYADYLFPSDATAPGLGKFLENARKWAAARNNDAAN